MKADKYLESIGLENGIGEEFMNDDESVYYTVEELMEAYHQSELDLITKPVVVGQRELLIDFLDKIDYTDIEWGMNTEQVVDDYLHKINL